MIARYPAHVENAFGKEETVIENDGHELRMMLRGVSFHGPSFEDFVPEENTDSVALQQFTLYPGADPFLIAFSLEWTMPIPVVMKNTHLEGLLHARFILGGVRPVRGGVDKEELWLTLEVNGERYASTSGQGWFDEGLQEIQKQLPEGMFMRTCLFCCWSEYGIYGYGLFADLACFRDSKEVARSIGDKFALMDKWDARTDFVQETYHCPEFDHKPKGAVFFGNIPISRRP